jgi:hypothetical protein
MSTRLFTILAALSGILGIAMLIPSFIINPGPPPNSTVAQLIAFGNQYHNSIVIGAWLQAVSPFLLILFAFAIVHLAGATTRLVGWMTMMAGTILVMVSLVEVVFYLSAANGNLATTGLMSLDLLSAVQHLYSMVAAPALFLALGIVILDSLVLPQVFGYLALALAGIFAALGIAALFSSIQSVVNILASVQGVWWLFAAITLLVRAEKASDTNLRSKS